MAVATRTRESNIWIVIGLLLTTMRFVDYFFGGRHAYDLIAGTGFVLVTVGACLNGFQTLEAITHSGRKSVVNGYALILVGMSLAVAAMAFKHIA